MTALLRVMLLPLQQCCSQTQMSHLEEQGTLSSTGFAWKTEELSVISPLTLAIVILLN